MYTGISELVRVELLNIPPLLLLLLSSSKGPAVPDPRNDWGVNSSEWAADTFTDPVVEPDGLNAYAYRSLWLSGTYSVVLHF